MIYREIEGYFILFYYYYQTIAQAITFENLSFELSLVCLQIVMHITHIYQGN